MRDAKDTYCTVITSVSKNSDFSRVLDFTISCTELSESENTSQDGETIGELSGFVFDPGYLPGSKGYDGTDDIFDSRSGHAAEAFDIIAENLDLIDARLGQGDFTTHCSGVVVLERGAVSPDHRGSRLMLRLMREAMHIFGAPVRMVILKAHPDGRDVSDETCRKLAAYYGSDPELSLVQIEPTDLAGWMIADWSEPAAADEDGSLWVPTEAATLDTVG